MLWNVTYPEFTCKGYFISSSKRRYNYLNQRSWNWVIQIWTISISFRDDYEAVGKYCHSRDNNNNNNNHVRISLGFLVIC